MVAGRHVGSPFCQVSWAAMASASWGGTPRRARRVSVSIGDPVRAWWSSATLRAWSTSAAGTAGAAGSGSGRRRAGLGVLRPRGSRQAPGPGRRPQVPGSPERTRGCGCRRIRHPVFGRGRVGEERAAHEGQRGPGGDQDAQPGRNVAQVEESGGGDVGAERGHERDEEPAPGQPGRAIGTQPTPRGDQEQVNADRVGPGFPAVLSGSGGEVVQVGEGQRSGDHGLDEDGVRADRAGHGRHLLFWAWGG